MASMNEINAVGRRKTSVARVYMFTGKEKGILVNKIPVEKYFEGRNDLIKEVMSPFDAIGKDNGCLIKINVKGGGQRGHLTDPGTGAEQVARRRVFAPPRAPAPG